MWPGVRCAGSLTGRTEGNRKMKSKGISEQELYAFESQLSGSQRRALTRMRRLAKKTDQNLTCHWQLGVAVCVIRGQGHFPYGKGWVERLALLTGLPASVLIRTARLASKFTESDMQELADRAVGWTVAFAALPLPTRSQRIRLLRLAASKRWKANRVRLEVRRLGQPQHSGPGRPPRRPRDQRPPAVELQELVLWARQWHRYLQEIWLKAGAILDSLRAAGQEDLPTALLAEADEALQLVLSRTKQLRSRLPGPGGSGTNTSTESLS